MLDQFFSLQPTHNSHRWFLPVTRDIAAGPAERAFLFGGVGLGAAIAAMERTFGRPAIWATAQYASFAPVGSIVDFDVHPVNLGKSLIQARVLAHIHEKQILLVSGALGDREEPSDQWIKAPPAPPPDDCPRLYHWLRKDNELDRRFEFRLIEGRFPAYDREINGRSDDGRLRMWIRSTEGLPASATLLAAVADFVVDATSHALGARAGGNSLDNTIRFAAIRPCEWLLCETRIETIHRGITHGTMKIFDETGVLMASASQSLILRMHPPFPEADG